MYIYLYQDYNYQIMIHYISKLYIKSIIYKISLAKIHVNSKLSAKRTSTNPFFRQPNNRIITAHPAEHGPFPLHQRIQLTLTTQLLHGFDQLQR